MSLRTEYIRNFYADHQTNFGQPDDTPTATVRAAALREFDEWLREVKAEAWDEAYRRGVDDARIADDLRVDVGLGPDLYAQPARQNPYRASETA